MSASAALSCAAALALKPDKEARAPDLHLLIGPDPRGNLHLHALDEDAVARAQILDDQLEGIESQPRVMPRDGIGIDDDVAGRNRAR